MTLAFTPEDRLLPPVEASRGRRWAGSLVYGLLLPASLITAGFAGWYMVTGETPRDIAALLLQGPRIELPMPPRLGPEPPSGALMQPTPAPRPVAAAGGAAKLDETPAAKPGEKPLQRSEDKAPVKPDRPPDKAAPPISLPAAPMPIAQPAPMPIAQPAPIPIAQPARAAEAKPAAVATASSYVPPPPPPPLEEPVIPPGGDSLAPPSFAQLPSPHDPAKPLDKAPSPDLLRQSAGGPLPIRAGGREAWKVYARPVTVAQTKPGAKIAVVVTGLGLSQDATSTAIAKLPPDVSLSFSPYGNLLDGWIRRAREAGHEALLDLPLEPPNFPQHDAGPLAVLASQSPGEALIHLDAILGKATSYVGLVASLHSPVTATESWGIVLQELKDRGLLLVGDGLVGIDDKVMPAASTVTLVADETPFRTAVDAKLARALLAAQRDGSAIVSLSARPVSFERLLAFIASLPEKGVTLVPVSALVRPEP